MKQALLLSGIMAGIGCVQADAVTPAKGKKVPNVVFIIADDLGYGELSCYGQEKFQTPNIDRLALEGMRFTQCYSGTTVSAPSRACLMTGLHSGHVPIRGNKEVQPEGQMSLPAGINSIFQVFKNAGYTTGCFGKWGLGAPDAEGAPDKQGVDDFFGYNCQLLAHNYYADHLWDNGRRVELTDNYNGGYGTYTQDLIHERGLQFLDDNKVVISKDGVEWICKNAFKHKYLELLEKYKMELTENRFRCVEQEVSGTTTVPYAEEMIDLGKPFERMTMIDAVKKYTGIDFDQVPDTAAAKKLADEKEVHYEDRHTKGDILNLFFEEFVEGHLVQPTFVMDHPVEISPLTKRKPDKPDYVERFELFITGREMCNAYSELNDPIDQRERFKAQEAALAAGDEEANTTDEDFMNALEIGMPPTGGIGYGIDRLVMLLTNSPAIRDVLLFPTMKSLDK